MGIRWSLAGAIMVAAAGAHAQEPTTAAVATTLATTGAVTPPSSVEAVAGATVGLEVAEEISSRTALPGAMFSLRLTTPISVDGREVVPAGTMGQGEVIHSAKASMGGKAGELILAARFLTLDGRRIPLRAFQIYRSGKNNAGASIAVSTAVSMAIPAGAILGIVIKGGETVVPVGAFATAKLTEGLAPAAPLPSIATGETP